MSSSSISFDTRDCQWFFGGSRAFQIYVDFADNLDGLDPDDPDYDDVQNGYLDCLEVRLSVSVWGAEIAASYMGRLTLNPSDKARNDWCRLGPCEYFESMLREALTETFKHLSDMRTLADLLVVP